MKLETTKSYSYRPPSTQRPTRVVQGLTYHKIHEALMGVFQSFQLQEIDLEALVHYALIKLEFSPHNYQEIVSLVKEQALQLFQIKPGKFLDYTERNTRRLIAISGSKLVSK